MEHLLLSMVCIEAFKTGGCEEVYKRTIRDIEKAKKDFKKEKGNEFSELAFETCLLSRKIENISKVLQAGDIMQEKDNRETIANELIKLAEELKSL